MVVRDYGATHSDCEDLFQEIALQVWQSVLRGLGYGVQPDKLNESVKAFSDRIA
jgi:hypothetical protein